MDNIEENIVDQSIDGTKIGKKVVARLKHRPGHILFEIDVITGNIKPAEIKLTTVESSVVISPSSKKVSKSLAIKPDTVYLYSLNRSNAAKKFFKILEGKFFDYIYMGK